MARETIKQRIALEGAEGIQAALKTLGKAGEDAFKAIAEAVKKADGTQPLEKLNKSVLLLKERLRDLGAAGRRVQGDLRNFGSSIGSLGGSFRSVITNVGLLSAALTGAVAGLTAFVKLGTEAADAAGKQAQALGLTIEQYGGLKFAIEQSGGTAESFTAAMSQFNRVLGGDKTDLKKTAEGFGDLDGRADELGITVIRAGQAVTKTADQAINASTAFLKLGVRVRDADGNLRSGNDVLLDIADAFAKMPDGVEKSALALSLFGRSGAQMIPFFNEGRAGIKALTDQAEKLGQVFTPKEFKVAENFNDALARTSKAMGGLVAKVGLVFAPALTQIADDLTNLIVENSAAIRDIASNIASRIMPVLKDFIAVLTGGEAANNPWIKIWIDGIVQFGQSVQSAVADVIIPAFNTLLGVLDNVAAGLNKVFGTSLDGQTLAIAATLLSLLGVVNLVASAIGVVVSGVSLLISAFGLLGPALAAAGGFFGVIVEGAALFGSAVLALVGWPALIIAGLVAAGIAIFVFWDDIRAAALVAWNYITGLFSASGLAGLWDGLASGAAAAWDAIAAGAGIAWDGVVKFVSDAIATIGGNLAGFGDTMVALWAQVSSGAGTAWDGLVTAAETAFAGLVDGAMGLWSRLEPAFTLISNGIGTALDAILPLVQNLWDGIGNIFNAGADTIKSIWEGISGTIGGLWTNTTDSIKNSAQAIVEAVGAANKAAGDVEGAAAIASALAEPFRAAAAEIATIWAGVTELVASGFDAPVAAGQAAVAGIGQLAGEITARLRSDLDGLISTLNAALSRITSAISSAISRLRQAAAEARNAGSGGGGGGKGFALGGLIRGAGSGRSDSIAIRASNGEFMVQAAAVRKYGVDFMRMLNSGRLSLEGLMPRFADGGLIGSIDGGGMLNGLAALLGAGTLQPRLAVNTAGVAPQRALRPINLALPGGETFEMLAPEDVARKVMQFATGAALRSAGRRPGWYK